METVYY